MIFLNIGCWRVNNVQVNIDDFLIAIRRPIEIWLVLGEKKVGHKEEVKLWTITVTCQSARFICRHVGTREMHR